MAIQTIEPTTGPTMEAEEEDDEGVDMEVTALFKLRLWVLNDWVGRTVVKLMDVYVDGRLLDVLCVLAEEGWEEEEGEEEDERTTLGLGVVLMGGGAVLAEAFVVGFGATVVVGFTGWVDGRADVLTTGVVLSAEEDGTTGGSLGANSVVTFWTSFKLW